MECFYGYLVGVLSTIVTVLIGWQIFTVISLESRLRRISSRLTKQYKENMHKLKHDATGMSLSQLGAILWRDEDQGAAFLILMNALASLQSGSGDDYNEDAKVNAIRRLNDIACVEGLFLTNVPADEKEHHIATASKIESSVERDNLLRFILKAETTEDSAKS